jgi:NTP pyrophosphatase (non-canonical NTP hydrolase)
MKRALRAQCPHGAQANKAIAMARLAEETAECDKALEQYNAKEMQQVGAARPRARDDFSCSSSNNNKHLARRIKPFKNGRMP